MKRFLLGFLGVLFLLPLYAMQHIPIKDGEKITGSISSKHLNRIYLTNDRIERVKTLEGQFQFQHDERSGELYIKPHSANLDKELNLYITSEQGFTYALTLLPDSETAQTLALDNASAGIEKVVENEKNNEIHRLLEAMHNNQGNDEIFKQPLTQKTLKTIHNQLAITHVANYWGKDYRGEILVITNDSRKTHVIHESDVMDENTIAVVLLSHQIERAQYTVAYRIKHHDSI